MVGFWGLHETKGMAKRLALVAGIAACLGSCAWSTPAEAASAAGAAADAANEFSKPNAASQELLAQERKIAERHTADAVKGTKSAGSWQDAREHPPALERNPAHQ